MGEVRKVLLLMDKSRASDRDILRGISQYSQIHGPWKYFRNYPQYRSRPSRKKPLSRMDVKGIHGIIAVMHELNENLIQQVRAARLPVIVIPTRRNIAGVPNVFEEKEAVGKMAAEYLLNLGFRHFAFCGFENLCWSQSRCEGFCRTIEKAGFTVHVYQEPKVPANLSWEKESLYLAGWLRSLPMPVGLMACNDDRGQLVIEACTQAGLLVPEQVAVVGVDNDELICDLADIPLSSVAMDFEKAGYEIARLLDEMMSGQPARHQILMKPTHIVARQSTDVIAIEDTEVAEAVRFIRNHAKSQIHVNDLMKTVTLSRRTLEMKFRKVLGRTIHEEIMRVRMEQIAWMLTETNLSISQIALSMGYPNLTPIWRSFRKEKGMTPLQYRKLHRIQ